MKNIVITVHDVSPKYMDEIKVIFKYLERIGVKEKVILVVPDFDKRYDIISDNFIELIKEQENSEIALHGLHHSVYEFLFMTKKNAKNALTWGKQLLSRSFNTVPSGFVAPMWLQSYGSIKGVKESGFTYTALFTKVIFFNSKKFYSIPTNFDWGSMTLNRLSMRINKAILKTKKSGIIRFAIHPKDVENGLIEEEITILKSLINKGWKPITYELLEDC